MTTRRSILVLLCAAALTACDKNAVQTLTEAPPGGSFIKYFNFGVSTPGVNFYANATKVTAILTASGAESTTGVAQGGAAAGGYYTDMAPGTYAIKGQIAAATDKNLAISNVSANLVAGKFYSFYISGIYDATAKTADAFIVEDPLPAQFEYDKTYVRLVNAISNSQPMQLYLKQTGGGEGPLGNAVAYKGAGAFQQIPPGLYDIGTRLAGATTNAITRTGVSFGLGKVYTVTARGDMTVTSSSSANRPQLDVTANR